jgi:hypothetical protein
VIHISASDFWPLVILAILGLGAYGFTRRNRAQQRRGAPQPRLTAVKDLGRQTIALDRPALVFRTQFGSGDQLQWNPQP